MKLMMLLMIKIINQQNVVSAAFATWPVRDFAILDLAHSRVVQTLKVTHGHSCNNRFWLWSGAYVTAN